MMLPLPARPSLEWLRKAAKDHLRKLRAVRPETTLTQAQRDLARQYGFRSWRAQGLHRGAAGAAASTDDHVVLLLACGADVNGQNSSYEHWSPLARAIDRDQPGMQRALLEAGARGGLLEALLLGGDAALARLLRDGRSALPAITPNGGVPAGFRQDACRDRPAARARRRLRAGRPLGSQPDRPTTWTRGPR